MKLHHMKGAHWRGISGTFPDAVVDTFKSVCKLIDDVLEPSLPHKRDVLTHPLRNSLKGKKKKTLWNPA